jgi:hypothetical protein
MVVLSSSVNLIVGVVVGITTDNPGVFRANPYPYPSKPVNPGVITLIHVHGYPISVDPPEAAALLHHLL